MDQQLMVALLAALAHEHRLAIHRLLVEAGPEGLPAGGIAERLGIVPSSLSFHIKGLLQAGLVSRRRVSRQLIYSADFVVINALIAALTANCCGGEACTDVPAAVACFPDASPA
ncbi:ArsR/SmtB family transcription factor [Ancylobacter sp. G4_0304]|uniref:ArsR/SmtB family transcription factor n=1 Tax=Ancylobacter sp. G4_0304 TaxID=3114289 RepID=UPI0039C6D400